MGDYTTLNELTKEEKILLFKALSTHINFLNHNSLRPTEEQAARELRKKLAEMMAQ